MKNIAIVAVVLALSGCMSVGDVDHPLARKATWFSYLNGDDIRQDCRVGSPERYRLIYNARFDRQVRTYEVRADDGGGASVFERVIGRANLLMVLPGLEQRGTDWYGHTGTTTLDEAKFAALKRDFSESGVYGAPPEGTKLDSDAFYWVSVACRDGQVHFNAWQYSTERFKNVTFGQTLMDLKLVDIRVPKPVRPPTGRYDRDEKRPVFRLYVDKDGLMGRSHLLGPLK